MSDNRDTETAHLAREVLIDVEDLMRRDAENVHLRICLMQRVQFDNDCPQSGYACRDRQKCGCWLEMEAWCK